MSEARVTSWEIILALVTESPKTEREINARLESKGYEWPDGDAGGLEQIGTILRELEMRGMVWRRPLRAGAEWSAVLP